MIVILIYKHIVMYINIYKFDKYYFGLEKGLDICGNPVLSSIVLVLEGECQIS